MGDKRKEKCFDFTPAEEELIRKNYLSMTDVQLAGLLSKISGKTIFPRQVERFIVYNKLEGRVRGRGGRKY